MLKKQRVEEFGWLTTLPLPMIKQAEELREQYRLKYDDVVIESVSNGFILKFRKPKKRRETPKRKKTEVAG